MIASYSSSTYHFFHRILPSPVSAGAWRAETGRSEEHTSELQSHSDLVCRPLLEKKMKDVFRSGDSSKKFKIAEGQWYRYAPSYVSPAYHLLEGFPFIQEPPSADLQERVLIRQHDYDQCFQSVQLLQWNSQVKFNVTVYRNLPTTRDSIIFLSDKTTSEIYTLSLHDALPI